MLAKTQFKKSTLSLSMNSFIPWHHNNKYLCLSIFLTLLSQAALAETPVAIEPSNAQVEPQTSTQFTEDIKKEAWSDSLKHSHAANEYQTSSNI